MNQDQLTNKLYEEEDEEVIHLTRVIEEYYRNQDEPCPLTPAVIAKQILLFYNDFESTTRYIGSLCFEVITSEDITVYDNYTDFKYDIISSVLKDDSKDEDTKRRFVEHFTEDSSKITETLISLNLLICYSFELDNEDRKGIERYIPIYLNEEFSTYSKEKRLFMNTRAKGEEGKWLIFRLWLNNH